MRMRFFLFLRLNTVFELLYKRAILSTICQQSFGTLGNMGYLRFIIRKNSCIKNREPVFLLRFSDISQKYWRLVIFPHLH